MTAVTIKRADVCDVATLAQLGARTFADTFGHLYPEADLAAFLEENHRPEAVAALIADPRHAAWLAEKGGEAIGYVLVGPCGLPHPEVTDACGELKRIYLLKDRQGDGVGARLMETGLAWLESEGRRPIWIGVWSQNHGAQRLYARAGFAKVGEYEFPVGSIRDREFILRRA
ncbi:MAG: GNAT family N-acetyltransferase [Caulobacteraceae bacterium]|nr:GNAT family N-acetyltransferase [Caulobacteraceae bacterium]